MRGLPLGAGQWRHGPRGQGWVSGRGCPLGGPGQKSQAGSRGQLAGSQTWRWQSHLDPSLGLPCPKQQAPSRCHMWGLKGHTPGPPQGPSPSEAEIVVTRGHRICDMALPHLVSNPPPAPRQPHSGYGRLQTFSLFCCPFKHGFFPPSALPRPPRGSTAQRPHRPTCAPLTSLMPPPPSSSP